MNVTFLCIWFAATVISSCKACADICINWKISNNTLVITCKISDLNFGVKMTDPQGVEQGYCFLPHPHPSCHAMFSNGSLTQNINSKETVLKITGKLDKRVNGFWTCFHGRFVKNASVEVTIPEPQCDTSNTHLTKECWFLLSHWTLLSFFTSFMIIYWIYLLIPYFSTDDTAQHCLHGFRQFIKLKLARSNNLDVHEWRYVSMRYINSYKFTISILLAILVVILPAIVGLAEKKPCKGYCLFIAFGSVMGITSSFIRLLFIGISKDLIAANEPEAQLFNREIIAETTSSESSTKMIETSVNFEEENEENSIS